MMRMETPADVAALAPWLLGYELGRNDVAVVTLDRDSTKGAAVGPTVMFPCTSSARAWRQPWLSRHGGSVRRHTADPWRSRSATATTETLWPPKLPRSSRTPYPLRQRRSRCTMTARTCRCSPRKGAKSTADPCLMFRLR